ncbi:MAG: heme-binding beta-barrel domain-containing protein [Candidatus Dormibacteria bacterium]
MPLDQPTHPALGRLAELLGDWYGEGEGRWLAGEPFHYREWVSFGHNGKPFVSYSQRTSARDDGRPLHAEAGYWRALGEGAVEVAIAHPIGVVEIEAGRWNGNRLTLRTATVECTPTAKTVTGLQREFEIDGDVLRYRLRMATDGGEPRPHLTAELRRTSPAGGTAER